MARGEGFYCSDSMCDGDHPLPSMTCDDPAPEPVLNYPQRLVREEAERMADEAGDGSEHHIEPPC